MQAPRAQGRTPEIGVAVEAIVVMRGGQPQQVDLAVLNAPHTVRPEARPERGQTGGSRRSGGVGMQ